MSRSTSDEEDVITYYQYRRIRRALRRRYWCHPYIQKNIKSRLFVAAEQLNQTDSKFVSFYRMAKDSYLGLLRMLTPSIKKMDTNMRECVTVEERILITLRYYLATGCSFVSLSLYFERGETIVGAIVKETTKVIWDVLNEIYMPVPTEDQWKKITDHFDMLWNLPNCIGALDGKHTRIEKFPITGSENFNDKNFHSIVLLICCDADGHFIIIEPGYAGRNSDGGIFMASAMNYWMTQRALNLPSPFPLRYHEQNNPFPYYFVGDKAFTLTCNLYKKITLDNMKSIFNYRLSRGRKTIECVFGMAAVKFAVLNGPIRCRNKESVNDIVKAACVLHNCVRKQEGIDYRPTGTGEENDVDGVPIFMPRQHVIHEGSSAATMRNYLANYFFSPGASLPWQWKYTVRTRNKE